MLRNVDKRLKSVNESRRESLRSDILIIQLARDRDIFRKAVELYQTPDVAKDLPLDKPRT